MDGTVVTTKYWHKLDDGRLQCDVCPRHCHLKDGQRGLCYVRQRIGDAISLVSYGRSSGFCVDPIEKKPLNHFFPGSAVLSFGTAGCNLACKFCQNWDMSKSREMDTLADQASPEQLARAARDLLRADGGGEVVMTSSVAGLVGIGSSIPYCASKAALNNLTVTLARALGPEIRVNAVAPGFIDGEWLREGLGDAFEPIKAAMLQKSPLDKVCTPDGAAQAILALITGPDLITGHVLPVDGGMLIGG